jgi:hypothetical protein
MDWFVCFPYIFLVHLAPTVLWAIVPTHFAAGILGGVSGFFLGNKIRGLIG